jgi:2'-5' RNA ligase
VAPAARARLAVRVSTPGEEVSALLLRCPAAEAAVGASRERLDLAARVGVPAHVTVTYPFRPVQAMSGSDHLRLERLFAQVEPFDLTGEHTAWFGDEVLYVALAGAGAVAELTEAVTAEFPEHPPYGGVFADVVPHLTVGHDHASATLRAAEEVVRVHLPFHQPVTEVELWSGLPPTTGQGRWRLVRSYPLLG